MTFHAKLRNATGKIRVSPKMIHVSFKNENYVIPFHSISRISFNIRRTPPSYDTSSIQIEYGDKQCYNIDTEEHTEAVYDFIMKHMFEDEKPTPLIEPFN